MKKYLLGIIGLTLIFPIASNAIESNSYQAEFGECFPDTISEESFIGKTLVNAKMRAVACMNGSKVVKILPANTKIKIIAKTDGWYKVKTTEGVSGWMGSWIVAKTSDTTFTEVKKEAVVKKEIKETIKSIPFGTIVSYVQSLSLKELYSLRDKLTNLITELEKKEAVRKEELEKKEALKKESEMRTDNINGKIILSGETYGNIVKLNWLLTDMVSKNGFKIVISEFENPVYPGNDYHYLTSAARNDEWKLNPGTYYFRVCEYLGGKCGIYSNNYKVVVNQ